MRKVLAISQRICPPDFMTGRHTLGLLLCHAKWGILCFSFLFLYKVALIIVFGPYPVLPEGTKYHLVPTSLKERKVRLWRAVILLLSELRSWKGFNTPLSDDNIHQNFRCLRVPGTLVDVNNQIFVTSISAKLLVPGGFWLVRAGPQHYVRWRTTSPT